MATRNCTFCGREIEPGTGFMYVRRDGAIYYFCSRKCKTNMVDLGRMARNTKWTREYHTIKKMKKAAQKS
ncbi:50S ribosomal protein L24e [Thermogymnomonas acidicola]|uniref:Large ribosomal subunit protein eL24 n=1 Tax=Thermogymnomonas acidicola TaxID=399579 RepID=A0AA37F9G7_9ARCH|nr:50S ribosomal protein L24e [Thermogymnomonas acidicola]GGM74169.1 50S ribosomal protein L24e [Thermogymnomonas acidicola]